MFGIFCAVAATIFLVGFVGYDQRSDANIAVSPTQNQNGQVGSSTQSKPTMNNFINNRAYSAPMQQQSSWLSFCDRAKNDECIRVLPTPQNFMDAARAKNFHEVCRLLDFLNANAKKDDDRKYLFRLAEFLDYQDEAGRTPLIIAVQNRDIMTAQVLVNHGSSLDHFDRSGQNALHYAIKLGNSKLIELLDQHYSKEKSETIVDLGEEQDRRGRSQPPMKRTISA